MTGEAFSSHEISPELIHSLSKSQLKTGHVPGLELALGFKDNEVQPSPFLFML